MIPSSCLFKITFLIGDLNEAILEPARESLRSRRRRAALADVIDDLDDLISDVDDK